MPMHILGQKHNVLANRTIVSFNSIDCTSQHPNVVNTAVSPMCFSDMSPPYNICGFMFFWKTLHNVWTYVLIYRCGDTNGLICLSMALAWLFLITPNMDTRSMKTSWPCPCKLPAQNEQTQQYFSNTITDRSLKCYVLTNITILSTDCVLQKHQMPMQIWVVMILPTPWCHTQVGGSSWK